ncbi:DUF6790 family protein [Streptacidiphilus cavernicola]|uniref:DUF6790 family protein n=1 Tax=Streptacidiphilus cavernicola TaxID=3342716 RepID=A0ABV6VW10_9ACTN
MWGATIGHVFHWFANGDHAAGNTGGILIPAVMIALAARDIHHTGRDRGHTTDPAA